MMLGVQTLNARRFAAADLSTGDPVHAVDSTFSVVGSIQPLSGRDRDQLAEGERTRGRYKLYLPASQPRLQLVDTSKIGDQVQYDGRWLEVINEKDWSFAARQPHRRYVLAEPGPDAPGFTDVVS